VIQLSESLGGWYLTLSTMEQSTRHSRLCQRDLKCGRVRKQCSKTVGVKVRRAVVLFAATAAFVTLPFFAWSQSRLASGDSSEETGSATVERLNPTYVRPPPRATVNNYLFDAFGPYPLVSTAFIAGLDQGTNTPPEWGQGFAGYAKRYGSDFGISLVGTSMRYGLAAVLREDTSYYRCDCRGVAPRMRYAVMSTLMARRGSDGHHVFSVPSLVAPYAGASAAVYGWYPNRYNGKDAFRMGNYILLDSAISNVVLEFIYSGPHALVSHMHLNNARGASVAEPSQ
jgi:hypothetical protein